MAGLHVSTAWGIRDEHVDQICMRDGQRVVDMCFANACHFRVAGEDLPRVIDVERLAVHLTSLLVLPLVNNNNQHGVIVLANPADEFDEPAQKLAETLCDMVIIALDNARLVAATVEQERLGRELDIAREVQGKMLPTGSLDYGSVAIIGSSQSCDETGGDYFTYRTHRSGDDTTVQMMIGDVTGHGLGAALYTTLAHAIAQQAFRGGADVEGAVAILNDALYHSDSGRFMTAVLMTYDDVTHRATYCSAGHNPILWLHKGEVRWLDSHTVPLGVLGSLPLESTTIELAPGDVLVLYTDGFTEAHDAKGELWGEERFAACVQAAVAAGNGDGQVIIDALHRDVDVHTGGQPVDDDLTLLIVTHGGGVEAATKAPASL